ncbi:MAG: DUF2267 domain-containing protein [Croceibacterium sp.]
MAHPFDVERASELHIEWCQDLARRLALTTTHQSGPQMQAVMRELRRLLTPQCVVQVANAFPALERGIFLEGWDLGEEVVGVDSAREFKDRVYTRVAGHHARIEDLVEQVFALWHDRLGVRSEAIRKCLPPPLAELWPH